ncbi:MAG: hypothetical protein IJK31_00515 [Ruminococcus sp.]|nr:hypothetical protein [Ruminococcus sp.]HRR75317.1 hypothetical protein [Ruminococcus sp.]
MPNYEELYYIARSNYYQAVDNLNSIRSRRSELMTRKNQLSSELSDKEADLRLANDKRELVENALTKARSVSTGEFATMKTNLEDASDEYKALISADTGVADIWSIYSDDITSTQNDLSCIIGDLEAKMNIVNEQVEYAESEVNRVSNELTAVENDLANVGDEGYAQSQVNSYYGEMKEYEQRWQNGE